MDVFKLAIHGTGYPLPVGYDELPAYLCITTSAPAWEAVLPSPAVSYSALERPVRHSHARPERSRRAGAWERKNILKGVSGLV
ncbi:MAG: hypothetical protein ACXWTS_08315 [Methylococcaceae bacterium]